jgi:gliding motility-associated-like protein
LEKQAWIYSWKSLDLINKNLFYLHLIFNKKTPSLLTLLLLGLYFFSVKLSNAQNSSPIVTGVNASWNWQGFVSQNSNPLPLTVLSSTLTGQCTKMCMGGCQTMLLSASGGTPPYTYSWSPNIGSGPGTYTMCPTASTVYSYTVTDQTGASAGGGACLMTVHPGYTTFSVGAVGTGCAGNTGVATTTLSGVNGPYVYHWSNSGATPGISNLSSGIYTVTVTDKNGCNKTGTATVTASGSPPAVSFTADDTSGCAPLCVNFNNTTPNTQSCNWVFGDGTTGNTSAPVHCYSLSGIYAVSLTVTDNGGCTGTLVKNNYIHVSGSPHAAFIANPTSAGLYNALIQFTDQSVNATQWNWSFGDLHNSSSSQQNPSFTYSDLGTYNVVLVVSNVEGCTDTTSVTINIYPDEALYTPNTFSPNGDNVNEIFFPKGTGIKEEGFEMYIFDRWGDLIYKTNNINKGWDGKANNGNDVAQQDVYVWKIKFKDEQGNEREMVGNVNLIR